MSTRVLKWLGVVLPVGFWLIVLALRTVFFSENRTLEGDFFALTMIAIGAVVFSLWVFGVIENREAEIRRRSVQLAGLHAAALALTTELDISVVLQKVVDLSRDLVHSRYGALGVLNDKGEMIDQFITSGISEEQRALIGSPPRGHGLLGVIIREGKTLRVPEIATDKQSVGFPPNHPPMHSFLGVPIRSKGRVIGNIYLTDKLREGDKGYEVFAEQDEEILEMFATQAAIAIENAQLYRQTQQLAIMKERERFGMDLHDGIIQSIYAVGLMLEDGQVRLRDEPKEANERIERSINGLNEVIRDIRNYILDLRPQRFQGRDLKRGLEELARDLRANSFLTVNLHLDSQNLRLTPEQTVETLHVVQEALSNIRKHAHASTVDLAGTVDGEHLAVIVEDNGAGFNLTEAERAKGHGLHNMRERARALRGTLRVESRRNGGTRLTLRVPLES